MASLSNVTIPMSQAAGHITCDITVKVTGRRRFDARVWLAVRLIKLAAYVLPVKSSVTIENQVRRF